MTDTIHLTALYDLGIDDPKARPYEQAAMEEMLAFSKESYRRNMAGLTDFVTIRSADHRWKRHQISKNLQLCAWSILHAMFRDLYERACKLWQESGANVLLCDIDTLCLRRCERPDMPHMRLFSLAEDPEHPVNGAEKQYLRPDTMFSVGLRWFPASMNPVLWDIGRKMWTMPHTPRWDYEQLVYNRMYYSQFPGPWPPERAPEPSLWTMHDVYLEDGGSISWQRFEDVKVRHYPNSRGSVRALARMREDWGRACGSDS